jgi:hypothetical protein
MNSMQMLQNAIDFQKAVFDTSFDTLIRMQDQTHNMIGELMDKTSIIPSTGQIVYREWVDVHKKSCQSVKTAIDDNFEAWSQYIKDQAA